MPGFYSLRKVTHWTCVCVFEKDRESGWRDSERDVGRKRRKTHTFQNSLKKSSNHSDQEMLFFCP